MNLELGNWLDSAESEFQKHRNTDVRCHALVLERWGPNSGAYALIATTRLERIIFKRHNGKTIKIITVPKKENQGF